MNWRPQPHMRWGQPGWPQSEHTHMREILCHTDNVSVANTYHKLEVATVATSGGTDDTFIITANQQRHYSSKGTVAWEHCSSKKALLKGIKPWLEGELKQEHRSVGLQERSQLRKKRKRERKELTISATWEAVLIWWGDHQRQWGH